MNRLIHEIVEALEYVQACPINGARERRLGELRRELVEAEEEPEMEEMAA